jgi:hypothetical protein
VIQAIFEATIDVTINQLIIDISSHFCQEIWKMDEDGLPNSLLKCSSAQVLSSNNSRDGQKFKDVIHTSGQESWGRQ